MNTPVFQRVLAQYFRWIWIPFGVLALVQVLDLALGHRLLAHFDLEVLGVRLLATDGTGDLDGATRVGFVSVGGLAIGALAVGGGAVGLIAMGGGAVGLVAIGGGALGVVALGGGAVGLIAFGGGGAGYYVLAGGGRGKHVLSYQRQDPGAVRFFCRYLPKLREAFPNEESGSAQTPAQSHP